jgi:hypothetical protein
MIFNIDHLSKENINQNGNDNEIVYWGKSVLNNEQTYQIILMILTMSIN